MLVLLSCYMNSGQSINFDVCLAFKFWRNFIFDASYWSLATIKSYKNERDQRTRT